MGNKFQIVRKRLLGLLISSLLLVTISVTPVLASASTGVTIKMQFSSGISSFVVTYVSNTEADFTWQLDTSTAATNIMIRGEYNRYPSDIPNSTTSPSDGYLVYYGDGLGVTTAVDNSLNQEDNTATLYYKAWAQNADGTWFTITSKSSQESGAMLFLTLIILALALTGATFVWQLLPLALGGMMSWWALAGFIILGGSSPVSITTTWGLVICILFVLLAFIPLIRYISRLGKTQVSHSDKQGRMYSLWEKKPEPVYMSRARQTQMRRRAEMRAVIDRASGTRRRRS